MFARTLLARGSSRAFPAIFRASYSSGAPSKANLGEVPANDPNPKPASPNVSETNALPTSSEGSFDKILQEDVATGEQLRTVQAPNRKGIWSRSQQPREVAMTGPRFEQTIFEDQVR